MGGGLGCKVEEGEGKKGLGWRQEVNYERTAGKGSEE